jgi:pyrimidine-nucleoside phosphorylase
MKAQAEEIGLALTGQTPDLAPADKVIYAIRDVTATTESVPLLVSSILCKKIAGGAETVVLDVKCGSGAFMKNEPDAIVLAKALAQTGREAGLNMRLAVTAMDEPLGQSVGNALEIRESLDLLEGLPLSPSSLRFRTLCIKLAGETLAAAGIVKTDAEGEVMAEDVIASGRGAQKAEEWFAAQGGPQTLADIRKALPIAPVIQEVNASHSGWIAGIHAETVGRAVIALGGGRQKKDDILDLSVGIEVFAPIGTEVRKGQPIARIHARHADEATTAGSKILEALTLSDTAVAVPPLILAQF